MIGTLSWGTISASFWTSLPWLPLCKLRMMRCTILCQLPCVLCIETLVLLITGVPQLVPQTNERKSFRDQIPAWIVSLLKPQLQSYGMREDSCVVWKMASGAQFDEEVQRSRVMLLFLSATWRAKYFFMASSHVYPSNNLLSYHFIPQAILATGVTCGELRIQAKKSHVPTEKCYLFW